MQIMLCAISSVSSGGCGEDCAYCTQSASVDADIAKFGLKPIEAIVKEAQIARKNHALGFCLVTSGRGLDDKKLSHIATAAHAVKQAEPNLMLIACCGEADEAQLRELKRAGIFSYNHNLETAQEFFPKICTTHSWQSRYETNLAAKRAGLELCCGGIYGLGESEADRQSLRRSLAELRPFSSPINFFIPHPALRLGQVKLNADEALDIVRAHSAALPGCRVMVAGGREAVLGPRQYEVFDAGAAAVVIGDYLTTSGERPSQDIKALQDRGFTFAQECH